MDLDLTRMPTGASGWSAFVDHATSLGDMAEVDYLELKGTLAFAQRSDRKRAAVVVARAILGMANRMPDVAEAHLQGYGVVLIGIHGRAVVGAEEVDGAVLRDAVEPYIGQDGPGWDHQFIQHSDGLVLALIVDPPHWGDRTHACRKDYSANDGKLTVRDGDIFLRLPGMTRPATSLDVLQLERRTARAPHVGADVEVAYDSTFDRVATEQLRELIEEAVDDVADELLSDLPSPSAASIYGGAVQSLLESSFSGRDDRSPARFRAEVVEWQAKAKGSAETVATEFLRFYLARGRFVLRNRSDRYLEGVRVQLQVPAGASALLASDTDYCDHGAHHSNFQILQLMPERPAKYGSGYAALAMLTRPTPTVPNLAGATSPFSVERTPEGDVVTWHVGDLPSRGVELGEELFAIVTDEHIEELVVAWTVTARGVHHVFMGETRLGCAQDEGVHLTWSRGKQQEEL